MSEQDPKPHDHAHEHEPEHRPAPAAEPAEDAGSQALATALGSSFAIIKFLMIVLVVLFFCSGIFIVRSQERAIILRFGKPPGGAGAQQTLGPGLHFAFPAPIDEVRKIPITELQKVSSTVGWYFSMLTPEQEFNNVPEPMAGSSLNPASEGYTITGDGNIIHVRATIVYHIEDPVRYTFDFVDASNAVKNVLDNSLIYVSARYKVDDALTRDKTSFQERIQFRVAELAQAQKLGIVVDQCQVETRAPRYLKPFFDAVLGANSARETTLNQAQLFATQTLNRAAAEAAAITNAAETDRTNLVLAVRSEAGRFTNFLASFRANRPLFVNTRMSMTVGHLFTNAEIFIVPEGVGGKDSELRLQLTREPLKSTNAPATGVP